MATPSREWSKSVGGKVINLEGENLGFLGRGFVGGSVGSQQSMDMNMKVSALVQETAIPTEGDGFLCPGPRVRIMDRLSHLHLRSLLFRGHIAEYSGGVPVS